MTDTVEEIELSFFAKFIQYFSVGEDCGECEVGQIQCKDGNNGSSHCIDRNLVCNQQFNCPLKEDENNCSVDASQIFNCLDQSTYIPLYRQCDNKTSELMLVIKCSSFKF